MSVYNQKREVYFNFLVPQQFDTTRQAWSWVKCFACVFPLKKEAKIVQIMKILITSKIVHKTLDTDISAEEGF